MSCDWSSDRMRALLNVLTVLLLLKNHGATDLEDVMINQSAIDLNAINEIDEG